MVSDVLPIVSGQVSHRTDPSFGGFSSGTFKKKLSGGILPANAEANAMAGREHPTAQNAFQILSGLSMTIEVTFETTSFH